MLNKVMIIGRLGRDPELRYTQTNGTPVTTLNVATDESYTDRDGNRQERTEWHRVSVYQRQAENCANFLRKGSLIYVEGSLQTRKWQDQQGQDRYTTEIKAQRVQFLDRKNEGGMRPEGESEGFGGGYQAGGGRPWQREQRQGEGYQGRPQGGGYQSGYGHAPDDMPGGDNHRPADMGTPSFGGEDLGSPFPSGAADGAGMDKVPF